MSYTEWKYLKFSSLDTNRIIQFAVEFKHIQGNWNDASSKNLDRWNPYLELSVLEELIDMGELFVLNKILYCI